MTRDRLDELCEAFKTLCDENRLDERDELPVFLALGDQVRRRQRMPRHTEWS